MAVAPTSVHPGRVRHRSRWVLVAIAALLLGGVAAALLHQSASILGGSGVPATQARQLPAFTSVELAGSNNVVIHVGEQQSVVVKADDNLLDRVTTEVQSGRLVIGTTPGNLTAKSPMSVEVAVPTLTALTLTGSGNLVVDGIAAESFAVALPGSGTITGSGTTTRLAVTVGGSGTVQVTRLVAHQVRAAVSGSGSIFVNATDRLDASVSGTGAILYVGNPKVVTKSITGTGAIAGD